jgi:thiol-disulfide isomerase/thioredoxin
MKKIFFSLVVLLFTITTFSQKTIDKPDYGFSNLPGKLTKIELTDSATIIHFYIKYPTGQWIFIPKESYIQDVNGGEKQFVTKTEGISIGERYTMPESGEVSYQLYFPKLNAAVNKVDFGEANEGGSWSIYDIVINETETSLLPKVLQGNWLQADGSNQWDYGFYNSNAVVDKAVWNYKTVDKKKSNYTIVLEREGKQKTIYAQLDKKGTVKLGENKENLTSYSTEKVANPNYKLANDEVYKTMVFKSDSATYSGFIKGYTPRAGSKTGAIYVNNVFTGNQDSYLIKIAEDGSFSVKFPIAHPQYVFVRLANVNTLVFVEPGKETFHSINSEKFLFMGDYANINTDLNALESISFKDYLNLRTKVLEMSPETYKKVCLDIKDKQIATLNAIAQKEFISQKAFQIKKLDIEFLAYEQILSYDMYKEDAERNTNPSTNKPEASYYNFITPSILNNELAVVSGNYSSFINRLQYARILRPDSVSFSYNSLSEMAKSLQENGITFSDAELQMLSASKLNDKIVDKIIGFYGKNYIEIQNFKKNHNDAYGKLQKKNPEREVTVGELAASLKTEGINLTPEEEELLSSFKLSELNKEEIAIANEFNTKYGESSKAFTEKYKEEIQAIGGENNLKKSKDKLQTVFGINESFVFDLFTLQQKAGVLDRNFTLFTENELKTIQKSIKHPFLSNYIIFQNDKMKAKLEANKTKTDFAVNTVKKTEGDELFESMIAKFKGKVIYVDFWATWCGPCMQGIKEIATLKEEMQNKDVVFLYITNPTSPEKTWNNSIPNIKGEHYRVTQDEWNYLSDKFNISGIPHYVLVNKKGEVVNPKLGFNSNEGIKRMLEEQMK